MFITLQFPLADSRRFVCEYTGRLVTPPWPLADPTRHFIRSVGPVRRRRPGFVGDWFGEDLLCDAKGAFKYALPKGTNASRRISGVVPIPTFRKYFAGGSPRWAGAVARIDVGFSINEQRVSPGRHKQAKISYFQDLALNCLTRPITVPGQTKGVRELVTTRDALARRMLQVTTSTLEPPTHIFNWWITPGCPLVLIETTYHSYLSDSLGALDRAWTSDARDTAPIAAHYFSQIERYGYTVPVWIVLHDTDADQVALRNLRIHLWRLHNEREVLKSILALCLEGKLLPAKSDALRDYLARQSDRLRRSRTEGFLQRQLVDYAYRLDDLINKGDLVKLKEILDSIGPGVSASVMPIASQNSPQSMIGRGPQTVIYLQNGNFMVEDRSQNIGKVENAGAIIGGSATVSGGTYQGSGIQEASDALQVDLGALANELARLRAELRSRAVEVDQDLVVASVAEAQRAATEGDRAGVIHALRKAGSWALSVATEVGAEIAAKVIGSAIGM